MLLSNHLKLLKRHPEQHELHEATTAPLFTKPVSDHVEKFHIKTSMKLFPQYGLLGGFSDVLRDDVGGGPSLTLHDQDPRIFFNTASPSSTFICGSQGSGKSHTLSCILENCLLPSDANVLPRPLTGLVFHYDTFINDSRGMPCEAAYLASNPKIKVRILCSPSNVTTIQKAYKSLNVQIEPLRINQSDLNTKRMMDLMAINVEEGPVPLYMHTVKRILREMRVEQQQNGGGFSYITFKSRVLNAQLTPGQLAPLIQRLDTLESFMPKEQTEGMGSDQVGQKKKKEKKESNRSNHWSPKAGCLTIVDLSCPCVISESACSLFNICLTIFLDQDTSIGRVIALDEAHKYMNSSPEAATLTNTLLSTVRLQRHLGARVVISTQEPTISPALLNLSSVTIVHRFTSPEWLRTLKEHLAGVASDLLIDRESINDERPKTSIDKHIFNQVVNLRVGEALLFAPSAMVGVDPNLNDRSSLKKLGAGFLKVRIRSRITADGGKSIMAA
ncbi:hypothetical protein F5884DRAFT_820471 [Xylogone sp. PMI_703]|nr:hypothetical protein F5884DRAFT_820471 [Xylogone sp. PMI_703]